jgi:hypothetical protein
LLGGLVHGFDGKAGHGLNLFRQKHLLNLLRGGQFAFKLRLAAADGGGAQQHDDGQRKGRQDSRHMVERHGKGAGRIAVDEVDPAERFVSAMPETQTWC